MTKHSVKKRVIFGLFAICVGALVIFFALIIRYDPIQHARCILSNGKFKTPVGPAGSPPLGFYCVYTYKDGGKECKSSDECEGLCLVTDETQTSSKGFGGRVIGGYGRCESTNRINSCFPGTIGEPFAYCS